MKSLIEKYRKLDSDLDKFNFIKKNLKQIKNQSGLDLSVTVNRFLTKDQVDEYIQETANKLAKSGGMVDFMYLKSLVKDVNFDDELFYVGLNGKLQNANNELKCFLSDFDKFVLKNLK